MPIPEWSVHDRPRERLRDRGARALSVRELLAILVGSGSGRGTALDVADRLMSALDGSVRRLASADVSSLRRVAGVGPATASRVVAALELGRRAASEAAEEETGTVRGPADVYGRMGHRLRDLRQEEFHVLLLDARHRVVRDALVTRGTLDASLIHPREVFRLAILEGAAGLILVHNHPSGDPTPSPEDRAVTRQLADAGRAVGIPVLDHVVVGGGRWRSLAEDGAL